MTQGLAGRIHDLIDSEPEGDAATTADSANLYSISNCQAGLAGISVGNFLIKQVADEIQKELPQITQYATLSPILGLRRWLDDELVKKTPEFLTEDEIDLLNRSDWRENELICQPLKSALMRLCATYLFEEKNGRPLLQSSPKAMTEPPPAW